jgi:hypothetical protein
MMPILAKSRGKRSQEERDDLRRFYKENYAVDYIRSEEALAKARQKKEELFNAIPTSMIMEEMEPPRDTFQLVRGDFRNKGDRVMPNTPAFLQPIRKAVLENKEGHLQLGMIQSDGNQTLAAMKSKASANATVVGAIPNSANPCEESKATASTVLISAASATHAPEKPIALNRLDLAAWLVSPEHPLTARVTVNRFWQQYFGIGLVKTTEDFGMQGEHPSHPELLDWLASELIRSGWQLKRLHKLILMSATYQQSDAYDENRAKVDPANRLWWRHEPVRLEAEILRDSILSVSGTLNRKLYGPAVKPHMDTEAIYNADARYDQWPKDVKEGPATWRRSIYVFTKRSNLFPFLQAFDAPRAIGSCARRDVTTVPTQGLTLLNDAFMREQSQLFAERVLWESEADTRSRVTHVYELALGRMPNQTELRNAAAFLKDQAKQYQDDLGSDSTSPSRSAVSAITDFCQVLLASNEFSYIN